MQHHSGCEVWLLATKQLFYVKLGKAGNTED